jgi:hypothetical protein
MSKLPFFCFFHLFSFFILSSRFLPLPFLSSPFPLPFSILIHLVIHRFLPHGLPDALEESRGPPPRPRPVSTGRRRRPPRPVSLPPYLAGLASAGCRLRPSLPRRPRIRGRLPPAACAPPRRPRICELPPLNHTPPSLAHRGIVGKGRRSRVEPRKRGSIHLLCGSRFGLHVRLQGWNCSKITCLAGLRVEPWLEPAPCQRGP